MLMNSIALLDSVYKFISHATYHIRGKNHTHFSLGYIPECEVGLTNLYLGLE